jgi:hypothetical protein
LTEERIIFYGYGLFLVRKIKITRILFVPFAKYRHIWLFDHQQQFCGMRHLLRAGLFFSGSTGSYKISPVQFGNSIGSFSKLERPAWALPAHIDQRHTVRHSLGKNSEGRMHLARKTT